MGAIDTIASYQGTSGSTLAAGTMASGDSATIRAFPDGQTCELLQAFYDDVTSPEEWRVRSPYLHDNVNGISFWPGATTPDQLLAQQARQQLRSTDTLTFEFTTAATTGKALGALLLRYSQLGGAAARLASPGDVMGNVRHIKPMEVTIASGSNTAGAWHDALWTATEDLLHADSDYAVLGIVTDVNVAAVAVKGVDTGNLRVSVPGSVNPPYGSDWFVRLSTQTGKPCIPVFNAQNRYSSYVSIISSAATSADAHIQLILAELTSRFPG